MGLFSKIFNKNQLLKQCPRCLGKGHVDWDDIIRLKQELKWIPGPCAYCNEAGKVDPKVADNVAPDAPFLVTNIPEEERKRILNGHPDAIESAMQLDDQIEDLIAEICHQHFEEGLTPYQIAESYLISKLGSDSYGREMQELMEYINRVIQIKGNENR